jgi:hypothetical protein
MEVGPCFRITVMHCRSFRVTLAGRYLYLTGWLLFVYSKVWVAAVGSGLASCSKSHAPGITAPSNRLFIAQQAPTPVTIGLPPPTSAARRPVRRQTICSIRYLWFIDRWLSPIENPPPTSHSTISPRSPTPDRHPLIVSSACRTCYRPYYLPAITRTVCISTNQPFPGPPDRFVRNGGSCRSDVARR